MGDQFSYQANILVKEESQIVVTDDQNREVELTDLPDHIRRKVEDGIRKGHGEVIVHEERTSVLSPGGGIKEEQGALSLDKVLMLLAKMRDSFDSGQLEYPVYEGMITAIIKDFISTLADDIKIDFVVNQISESGLSDYINDDMLKELRAFALSSVSDQRKGRAV